MKSPSSIAAVCLILLPSILFAEQIPVRHREGVALGFLVLRDLSGRPLAYGELKQVVEQGEDLVVDDLQFRFKDGSYYREITKFTQKAQFHLISDQVIQKGPSFKQQSDSLIDAASGSVMVKNVERGKEKVTHEHLDIPSDVANGLLLIIAKNLDPSVGETTLSLVAASDKPRLVKLNTQPWTGKEN